MNKTQLVTSDDGSHTLFVPRLNEHYHSAHGAIQESRHIFIDAGLGKVALQQPYINLLEVGFGTGLNALLSCLEAERLSVSINYVTTEPFPLDKTVHSQLNYGERIAEPGVQDLFAKIHSAAWNLPVQITAHFTLNKIERTIQELKLSSALFHLVYFDAFSPEVQPEMWTEGIFEKLYDCLATGGVIVTYCCKGTVKRALKSSGFMIEKLPGPPGKRDILRATKS